MTDDLERRLRRYRITLDSAIEEHRYNADRVPDRHASRRWSVAAVAAASVALGIVGVGTLGGGRSADNTITPAAAPLTTDGDGSATAGLLPRLVLDDPDFEAVLIEDYITPEGDPYVRIVYERTIDGDTEAVSLTLRPTEPRDSEGETAGLFPPCSFNIAAGGPSGPSAFWLAAADTIAWLAVERVRSPADWISSDDLSEMSHQVVVVSDAEWIDLRDDLAPDDVVTEPSDERATHAETPVFEPAFGRVGPESDLSEASVPCDDLFELDLPESSVSETP